MSNTTRETIGKVTGWGQIKEVNSGRGSFKRRALFLDKSPNQYGHSFKGSQGEMEQLEQAYPKGSMVKVIEEQNGQYWNVTKIFPATQADLQAAAPVQKQAEDPVPVESIDEKPPSSVVPTIDRERLMLRENSGYMAASYLEVLQKEGYLKGKSANEIELAFLVFAEKWEEACMRPAGMKILQFFPGSAK